MQIKKPHTNSCQMQCQEIHRSMGGELGFTFFISTPEFLLPAVCSPVLKNTAVNYISWWLLALETLRSLEKYKYLFIRLLHGYSPDMP